MGRSLAVLLVALLSATLLSMAIHSLHHLGELYADRECPICAITGHLTLALGTPPGGEPLAPAVPLGLPGEPLAKPAVCISENACRAPPSLPT